MSIVQLSKQPCTAYLLKNRENLRVDNKMIVLLSTALLLYTVSGSGTDHTCSDNKTEPAGFSGTVHIKGDCHLTLTNISGNISIFGVRSSSCEGNQQLSINDEMFCIDENATTTIIDADENALEVKAEQVNSSIIEYYHGKIDR